MTEHRAHPGLVRRLRGATFALLALAGLASLQAQAQAQKPEPVLEQDELVDLVAPIALYPDDLLAIVLPAATYPLQVVEAHRLLAEREANPGLELEPDPDWDDSVVALLNYPEALELLNDDLDWTWQLGEAVLAQQGDLLEAVELFRDQAWLAGNLRTDDYQTVTRSDEGIEIRPAAPDVVYVPYYDPVVVVRRSAWPVYHYHPHAYPLYYYPYPVGHRFYSDWFWGVSTAFAISWRNHYLHLHYYDHVRHPFYGRRYLSNRYYRHRRALDHHVYRNGVRVVRREGQAYRWHPRRRHGARPGYRRYGARNGATIAYTDRSSRRGWTARTERAARINRERARRGTVDTMIDRDRRNARRNRGRDRSRDIGGNGSRTQRFSANGRDRYRDGTATRNRDRNADNGNRRTQRFAANGRDRNRSGNATRNRDRNAANGTPRTQRFASNGSSRSRTEPTPRRRESNGAPGRTQRFSTGDSRGTRAATSNRERRATAPRRQAVPLGSANSRRDGSRAQRPAPRPQARGNAPRAERRAAPRQNRSAPKRSAKRERSRSDSRRRRN